MGRTPELKSFLVADRVLQEKGSDKWSIIGVFDKIWGRTFPMVHGSLGIFAKVADVEGTHQVRIELRDDEDRCLADFKGMQVSVQGPPQVISFGIQTQHLPIPRPGKYHFSLWFGSTLVALIPIEAVQAKPPGAGPAVSGGASPDP